MYNAVKNACTTVYMKIGQFWYSGSGAFITLNNDDLTYGLFLTCAHNVINVVGSNITKADIVYLSNPLTGNWIKVNNNKIYYDGIGDIALFHTNIDFSQNSDYPLKLSTNNPTTGEDCCVVGNPMGVDHNSYTKGVIRDSRYFSPDGYQVPETLYVDCICTLGNSGGPILNMNGHIIGIYTFSDTNQIGFGGGSNLTVLKHVIPLLKGKAITNDINKRLTSKFYLGMDYIGNSPMYAQGYPESFLNQGVMIAKVSDISPFKNVLEFGDLLLSATIVNSSGQSVEYKFGSRVNQYPPGILIYRPVNNKIQIKYIKGVYFNNNNTIQEAEIDLTTYGQIGENYAYLDCFLRGASMAPMKKIKNLDLNEN